MNLESEFELSDITQVLLKQAPSWNSSLAKINTRADKIQ